ncbi:MAG: glycoside hydrolase/phage tail family protein [Paracoccaceae bacterium]
MRIYKGRSDQLPDPTMEAIEGAGNVPAYRGTAYVVMENLPLEQFGNRVPQFTFEVVRPEQRDAPDADIDLTYGVRGVAFMPGTGEYALATSPVYYTNGPGSSWSANINSPSGRTDFETSLLMMRHELPNCRAVSLVVSWFGDDLRCGSCEVRPKIEKRANEGKNMPWTVAGLNRNNAQEIVRINNRPIYGGTPSDQSVVEAIRRLNEVGRDVMFYPFILMDQIEGNTLPDPYSAASTQPKLPWRGRITLSKAPGVAGSPDGTVQANAQVAAFFGTANASHFSVGNGAVTYNGPNEWSLRRFILHNAAICAAAGGVSAFCISSEMRGLTQIRGAGGSFVAVQALRALAEEVRALLGPSTKISYAADWTEYFGYQPQDGSNDRYFHLDSLWADQNIDFIGIDNYMPLSDWRDGTTHLDANWKSIYELDYLKANIAGGDGYDWYYPTPEAQATQMRTPIEDLAHSEPWIWRYKDIRNWWSNVHHERVGGVRQSNPTPWVPESKPIWFTELGCAAVDKATNQPNKFLDAKSSESTLPKYSSGARDDLIQMQYLRAMFSHWGDVTNNPVSSLYGSSMVDMSRAFVWAWDTRPYPFFPNNTTQWSDGENYARGHWISGRTSSRPLSSVVGEICREAGLTNFDTSELFGYVRGYTVNEVADARSALQPLMLRHAFDAVERDGVLRFVSRTGTSATLLDQDTFVRNDELDGIVEQNREADAEMAGRVRVQFLQADADFAALSEEAILPDQATHAVSASELALSLTRAEGRQTAERWLSEARVARDTIRFSLPPSRLDIGAGDVVTLPGDQGEGAGNYRVDRVEQNQSQIIEAVRIDPEVYVPIYIPDDRTSGRPFTPPTPVLPLFLDLPLMTGDEVPHAPHLVVTGVPWSGGVALYSSLSDQNYKLNQIIAARSTIGTTENEMKFAPSGVWDTSGALQVKLISGALESSVPDAILNGGNLAAIGDGTPGNWELFQFQDAELIAPDTYLLSNRLRGQLGSDGLVPTAWPVGSWFVLLNGAAEQISMSGNLRRLDQHFRVGPARSGLNDPSYQHIVETFDGNGLRPYAPCHLSVSAEAGGDHKLNWIRRTRIDGDPWELPDVPLGEESEHYSVQVHLNNTLVREETVSAPSWVYTTAMRSLDAVVGPYVVSVSQLSARFGAGLSKRIDVDL